MTATASHPQTPATTTLQIRNVPQELNIEMKIRAAAAGMSLSEYLLKEIKKISARPSQETVRERIRASTPVEVPGIVEMVREMRGD